MSVTGKTIFFILHFVINNSTFHDLIKYESVLISIRVPQTVLNLNKDLDMDLKESVYIFLKQQNYAFFITNEMTSSPCPDK